MRRPRPCHRQPRADCALIDHKPTMIPANTPVNRPRSKPHLILDEEGLLAIGAAVLEAEDRRGIRIEGTQVRNLVPKTLSDRSEVHVTAYFPLVRANVDGHCALHIQLSKAAILLRGDGRGRGVRPQTG